MTPRHCLILDMPDRGTVAFIQSCQRDNWKGQLTNCPFERDFWAKSPSYFQKVPLKGTFHPKVPQNSKGLSTQKSLKIQKSLSKGLLIDHDTSSYRANHNKFSYRALY